MAAQRAVVTPAKKTAVAKKVVVRTKKSASASEKMVAHEVRAYIPDPEVAKMYVPRKVFGVWDKTIADNAMEEGVNILLDGPTGSGKTHFGEAYAAALGSLYYSLPCDVSIDPPSLFGKMQPTEIPGKFEWQDGPVTQIVRSGGVLNISEVNFMTPKIAASLYSLLDRRRYLALLGHRGEVVRPPSGRLLIIGDMNGQYRGTMELNAAFKNRWKYKLPWGYDLSVEEKLVKFPTTREIALKLREMSEEIRTPVSTNMLMEFESSALNKVLGLDFAIQNFVSAFNPSEKDAVARNIELLTDALKNDIRFLTRRNKKAVSDEDLEEIEFEQELEA